MSDDKAPTTLFRPEAILHQRARAAESAILEIDPTATGWGFRLLYVALAAAVAFLTLGRLNEYATGPAVVQLDGRIPLTASQAAVVTKIEVHPGDAVREGDVLVRFYASDEVAELNAVSREFDDQLAKLLQKPDDSVAREALMSLRTRRELAKTRVEQRTLRAPHAGTVADIRVRQGQLVEVGTSVLELYETGSKATVVALLPGRYRPLLKPGHELRFELDGFQRRTQKLTVSALGDQIIGPTEAARYLGRDLANAFAIQGPVVLVRADLGESAFTADGQKLAFAHGMYGTAEAIVRNEPIAYAFVPALKEWIARVEPRRWLASLAPGSR